MITLNKRPEPLRAIPGNSTRMRMRQDDRSGVALQGFFDDFSRVHGRTAEAAAEELDEFDQPMPAVQEE
jgi:hypothetical protein